MIYAGTVRTVFDESDSEKSLVLGTGFDEDGTLYVAFHIDGRPVLRNAKFVKDGTWNRGEQPRDKRTFLYLDRESVLALYDSLGRLLEGEVEHRPDLRPLTSVEDALGDFL